MLSIDPDPPFKVAFLPLGFPFAFSPILSFIANSIVVISFISLKRFPNPLSSMIFAVNFMDMLYFIPKVVTFFIPPSSPEYCRVFQMISQYAMQSSLLWSSFFGHALMLFTKKYDFNAVRHAQKYYFMVSMLVPLPIAILMFFYSYAGYEDGKCVLTITRYEIAANASYFCLFISPIVLSIIMSLTFYKMSANNLRRFIRENDTNSLLTLLVYPGIIIICWMPVSLLNLTIPLFGTNPSPTLVLALQLLAHLQGFFEAIVYSQSKFWLRQAWDFVCCCCKIAPSQKRSESQPLVRSDSDRGYSITSNGRTVTEIDMERHKSENNL